jgi:tripartite ATP-independent transporter DctP family solute receptor
MFKRKVTGRNFWVFLLFIPLLVFQASPSAAQTKPEFKFDISCVLDPQHPLTLAADMWAKLVNERTKGRVLATVYPNSQLGGDRETIQATMSGMIQGNLDATTKISNFIPQLAVLDLPYLADSTEKAYALLDGKFGDELVNICVKSGLRPMGYWEVTLRHIYSSKVKIQSIGDLKGLKIRVIPSPSFVSLFKALGASPTPMNFGELYTGLSQGVVDAAENDLITYYTTKHFEVAKNMALTNHIFLVNTLNLSERHFSKLPSDIQKIMMDAAREAKNYLRKNRGDREKSVEEQLKTAGVAFTRPDLKPFVEKGRGTYPEFEGKVGKDLITKVLEASK